MAQARFPVYTALALALLAVACSSAAADCLSQYGPGCTNCVNVTMTTGNRRLQQQVSAQHARAGMSGRGGHGLAPFVRNDTGSSGHHDGVRPPFSAEFLTCTACDSAGYVYKTETRGANTFGHCECAPGWGVQITDPNTTDMIAPRPRHGNFICVDCSLTGQVPLTDTSGMRLTVANGTWSLVFNTDTASSWNGAWVFGKWRKRGAIVSPPPYYRGQCVTCPEGSAASADFTTCVASA